MSSLLASLALLALCWQPSAGLAWKMDTQNLGSYIVNAQPEVGKAIQGKTGEVTMEQVAGLLNLVPNTLLMFYFGNKLDNLKFVQKPLAFGFMCELGDPELPGKLNEILYDGPPTTEQKQELAKAMRDKLNIDCAKNPPTSLPQPADVSAATLQKIHNCFCEEDKGAYCSLASLKFGTHDKFAEAEREMPAMIPCPSETLPALLNAGSGALGATWKDLDKFGPETINNAVSDNVDAFTTADTADILCDAVNPAVEKALKAVYASNGAYWFAEMLMFAKAFSHEPTEKDIDMSQLCREKAVIENPYGKCFCNLDTGFTFCIYKVIAEAFINKGILTCDKTDKTKQKIEKRAAALPYLALPKGKPDSKGPTGGAATSSLTIATLAAAALLLLRQ